MTSVEAGLTANELAVLTLIARGHTDESVSRHLGVSPRTVRRRLEQAMIRFGASTRMETVVRAVKAELIE